MQVIKNNGSKEPLDLQKFRNSLIWAKEQAESQGAKNISISDIEMQCNLHMYDGISTSYILDVAIKTTYDMSTLRYHGYDLVSRNLKLQKLYKSVFGGVDPISLKDFIVKNKKYYENSVIVDYSEEELNILDTFIDHSRDFTFSASGLDKTLTNDALLDENGNPLETPQLMFMLIAMDTFHHNLADIKEVYDSLSNFEITLPTPELKSLRTYLKNYASCCTVRIGDNIDSWKAGSNAIVDHTCASAGVGVDIADIASIGDKVSNGKIKHNGKVSIIKSIDTDVGKTSQNGRRGSATAFINFYDPEIETILGLKSPRTAVEKRVNDLSYGIKLHELAYIRASENGVISLFSVRNAPKLNSLMYGKDIKAFIKEYERCEKKGLYTSQINAADFMKMFATEKQETSSYYIVNMDEINLNTPYQEEISQANICVEFCTPTKVLQTYEPDVPAIGICVLGNVNQSKVGLEDLPRVTRLLVRLQTMLALRQNHPTPQANAFVSYYRDIGIGFSNHANWLAKQGLKYGEQEALDKLDEWMEHFSYGLISASCDLVDEFGKAPGFDKTNWATKMPIDRYKKTVDELTQRPLSLDWKSLQKRVKEKGMANCGLSMIPPSESSSIGSNQTSSIEPIKEPLTVKDRQGILLKQYAPEVSKLAHKYDYAYDRKINKDYIKNVAIVQKWTDKAISSNVFYNPELYPDDKIDIKDIIEDMYFAKYYGLKTAYYQNTKVKDANEIKEAGCAGGGCSV